MVWEHLGQSGKMLHHCYYSRVLFSSILKGLPSQQLRKISLKTVHSIPPIKGSRGLYSVAKAASDPSNQNGSVAISSERVEDRELQIEASESYLSYAMSVIVGRALPDVRDGLKPVHRRILYAMYEMGMMANKPHRKCARVVGEVLGKFHPHGDSAVYAALVRMAQDFSMRVPLVSGHGNFGSVDADPPAAMRYTECRLQSITMDMLLEDMEANTVDFTPTFDGSQEEPSVLPSKIPQLLVNGSSGIAVGVATRIPPHNLSEVLLALKMLIKNSDTTVDELMSVLPGPDFPTGGEILKTSGLHRVYSEGRGSIMMRAMTAIEGLENGESPKAKGRSSKPKIIITELPYQICKADLVADIANMVENRTLEGISDVRDESDRDGIRVVVEIKRGSVPQVVLNNLFKHTNLQTTFPCNMVALVDGVPKILNIKEILRHFLDFRCEVIERRSRYHLQRAEERLHLLEGFLLAMQSIEEVVKLIRSAKESQEAKKLLRETFQLSSTQAEGILALPLRRLTSFEAGKLQKEQQELLAQCARLRGILASPALILEEIEKEASVLERKHRNARLSALVDATGELSDMDILPNEANIIVFSKNGFVKRMTPSAFTVRKRGGVGVHGAHLRRDDSVGEIVHIMLHDQILFFTESGTVYSLRGYQLPMASRTSMGTHVAQVLPGLKEGDRVTRIMALGELNLQKDYLLMLTRNGLIKRTPGLSFKNVRSNGLIAMKVMEGDKLSWVGKCSDGMSIMVVSDAGTAIRFKVDIKNLRPRSRQAGGTQAMNLKKGSKIVDLVVLPHKSEDQLQEPKSNSSSNADTDLMHASSSSQNEFAVLVLTLKGIGKRVLLGSFKLQRRGGHGTKALSLNENDKLVSAILVGMDPVKTEVMIASEQGMVTRTSIDSVPIYSRTAKGVKLMNLKDGDIVKGMTSTVVQENIAD